MKKVTFINTMPGLSETWPIQPANKAVPQWVRVARDDYVKSKDMRQTHVFKCSGIGSLYKTGFVVPAWHDVRIYSEGENEIKIQKPDTLHEASVDVQQGDGIAKFIPRRPWSSKSIIKFSTPWHIISDVNFLMIPIAYPDNFEFEACHGILEPSISTEINVQVFWNKVGVPHTIDAGTPLCHLIPLCDEELKVEIRDATAKDMEWLKKRHYVNHMGFNFNIKKIKNLYNNFWK